MDLAEAELVFKTFKEAGSPAALRDHDVAMLDALGYQRVKAAIDARSISPADNRALALEWLSKQDRVELEKDKAEQRARADAALRAAQDSADASRKAASWAMWAALLSLLAVAVGVMKDCAGQA
jgi:regulator of protease activity HflC (stomatin/prohibitin superfamily)